MYLCHFTPFASLTKLVVINQRMTNVSIAGFYIMETLVILGLTISNPDNIYLFKVNSRTLEKVVKNVRS